MDGNAWYLAAAEKHANKRNPDSTIAIILRGIPYAPASVEFYTGLLTEHFSTLAKPVTMNGHEFGGVKSEFTDGSLTFVCNNDKSANTAPKLPLVVNGMELGNISWARRQASLCGKKVCKDEGCRGIGGHHIAGCKRTEVEKRSGVDKSVAISKAFSKKMQENSKQLSGVRKYMDTKYKGVICRGFNQKGIPCKVFCCKKGPCCDWEELLETNLAKTIYADMPESIRRGAERVRGARGGRKEQQKRRGAGKENISESEQSGEEGGF